MAKIPADNARLLDLKRRVAQKFDENAWLEVGLLTNQAHVIQGHPRLLRSLAWGDGDYEGNVLDVLIKIKENDLGAIATIEDYLAGDLSGDSISASSTAQGSPRIYVQPTVFQIPTDGTDFELASAMMPFEASYDAVYGSIQNACTNCGIDIKRADNIWEHSTIIQDIFSLIYKSYIVVCDFSGTNPNVLYEAGIAHTLGKHVIPIVQDVRDLPFDLRQHRCIIYLNNNEGLSSLRQQLIERIQYLLSIRPYH